MPNYHTMHVDSMTAKNVVLEGVTLDQGIIPFPNTPAIVVPNHSGLPMTSRDINEIVTQDFGNSTNMSPTLWQFQQVSGNIYFIFSLETRGALQPQGKSSASEAPIETAAFDGDAYQQWEFIRVEPAPGNAPVDIFNIRNVGSGLYLDVFADNLQPGEMFIQFPLLPPDRNPFNQRFTLAPFGPPFGDAML